MSRSYAAKSKRTLQNHLIPTFGAQRLDMITDTQIDSWLTTFRQRVYEDKDGNKKQYKAHTANNVFLVLNVMLKQAVKKGLIKTNPCANISMLNVSDEKKIVIFTPEEVALLFPSDWARVWGDRIQYLLNRLASISGMRLGELLGLRGEYVHENHIEVCAQYSRYGYTDTKTHKSRNIPLPSLLRTELESLLKINGKGYIFSTDDGLTPVSRYSVYAAFKSALAAIGIDEKERARRNLSMHGWRHFFSTELEMNDIPDERARVVTGHASKESRKRYNHSDILRMQDVSKVQEQLLSPKTDANTPVDSSAVPAASVNREAS
jgi:integrase